MKPAFDAELGCPVIEIPSTDIRKEVKIEIFGNPSGAGAREAVPVSMVDAGTVFFCKFVFKTVE